jgi:hypothetical protein
VAVARNRDVLALDAALEELARLNPRQASGVELRFFGGLNVTEIVAALGVSEGAVERDWRKPRSATGSNRDGQKAEDSIRKMYGKEMEWGPPNVEEPGKALHQTHVHVPSDAESKEGHRFGALPEILVEAAGVEPASEKARREKNYVRFRFGNCRPPH